MTSTISIDDLRQQALRVGAFSEVNDVRLFRTALDLAEMPGTGPYRYDLKTDVTKQLLPDGDALIVTNEYVLAVKDGSVPEDQEVDEAEGGESFFNLSFTLAALFTLTVPDHADALREEELDAFAKSTGQLAIHPYAREFIASMTGRAGLPALHVGLFKLHLKSADDDAGDSDPNS